MEITKMVAFGLGVSLSLLMLWFVLSTKKWKHDQVGYGYPENKINTNGIYDFQSTYTCRFCDGEVTQDSNGDWFHLSK